MTDLKKLRELADEILFNPWENMVEHINYRGKIVEWFCLTKPEIVLELIDRIEKLEAQNELLVDALKYVKLRAGDFYDTEDMDCINDIYERARAALGEIK